MAGLAARLLLSTLCLGVLVSAFSASIHQAPVLMRLCRGGGDGDDHNDPDAVTPGRRCMITSTGESHFSGAPSIRKYVHVRGGDDDNHHDPDAVTPPGRILSNWGSDDTTDPDTVTPPYGRSYTLRRLSARKGGDDDNHDDPDAVTPGRRLPLRQHRG